MERRFGRTKQRRGSVASALSKPRSERRASAGARTKTAAPLRSGSRTLVGRDRELDELAGLVSRERLTTLTGPPGIGKSRLAGELAAHRRGARSAAVVELAAVSRSADVARAVAAALSVDEVGGERLVDTLVRRLSRRRLLLVLDNCEHLLAACAELVAALLSGCAGLRVVATSREPLGVAQEVVWQVPPLAVPPQDGPEQLESYASVALFVERAEAVQPGFALNAYVAPAVAEICRGLDGIPLAIELAAARVDSLTAAEIAGRLNDRFDLLGEPDTGAGGRHRTLLAALDWSHDLLSEPERMLLRRLSVFAGGFGLEAARAVCGGSGLTDEEVGDLLARLVAKSLVVAEPTAGSRFGLLETIRAYAGQRLGEAKEAAGARRAHAAFYLDLAERAEPKLTTAEQERWLDRLERERSNLRSAVEWFASRGATDDALRLAGALTLFWRVRCHFTEGRELLEGALSAADGEHARLEARVLWGAGFMACMTDDNEAAVPWLEAGLARFRELGDTQGCARALLILANCRQYHNPKALALLGESAALAREARDSWCLAHALGLAGLEHCFRDELADARPLLEQCVTVAREAKDKQGLRFGLLGLGQVAICQGDYRSAEVAFEETLAIAKDLGEEYTRATALLYLGQCAMGRGDSLSARESLDESLGLLRELKPAELIAPLVCRALVAGVDGDRRHARGLLEEALTLGRGGAHGLPSALLGMGKFLAEEDDRPTARRMLEEAVDLARSAGNKRQAAWALSLLGGLARADGDLKRAAVLHSDALALRRDMGNQAAFATSLEAIAGVAAVVGRAQVAAQLLGAAQTIRGGNDVPDLFSERDSRGSDIALTREQLSDKEFHGAFTAGAGLSFGEVFKLASKGWGLSGTRANGWEGLTPSEREVAELVAEGMTNIEIAEVLLLSRSTVRNRLSRIFSKLGIERRTELVRELSRRRSAGRRPDR